eukprot:CAMPEP_0172843972 /NCGR_PEP_ID=MMETSP1075-20121228/31860_1 /TAXON_ID=2916 /ORGANISM="Ceratium fusus, Strain PA161109" /LENGTH=550 /DNA_ID=CAMNT_0013688329 /DNA_START=164 /DNA_END=1816 /DNA_ORIENTATION=-
MSDLRDRDSGNLVARPLQRGSRYCQFHLRAFCEHPATGCSQNDACTIFLDLETTSLDVTTANVVELGAVHLQTGAAFASLVNPTTCKADAAHIHGIHVDEFQMAPKFATVFQSFLSFVFAVAQPLQFGGSGSADMRPGARAPGTGAAPVLVAHNGRRFDFAILCAECRRHGVPIQSMVGFHFVDTMDLFSGVLPKEDQEDLLLARRCCKLQCLAADINCPTVGAGGLLAHRRPHRALDDAIALLGVVQATAVRLDRSVMQLVAPLTSALDVGATEAALEAMGVPQGLPRIDVGVAPSLSASVCLPPHSMRAVTAISEQDKQPSRQLRDSPKAQFALTQELSHAIALAVEDPISTSPARRRHSRMGWDWRALECSLQAKQTSAATDVEQQQEQQQQQQRQEQQEQQPSHKSASVPKATAARTSTPPARRRTKSQARAAKAPYSDTAVVKQPLLHTVTATPPRRLLRRRSSASMEGPGSQEKRCVRRRGSIMSVSADDSILNALEQISLPLGDSKRGKAMCDTLEQATLPLPGPAVAPTQLDPADSQESALL